MSLSDLIDDIVHVLDLRTHWRIYFGAACGFLLVLVLSLFLSKEAVSPFAIACCLVIPAIAGGIWHRIANKDD